MHRTNGRGGRLGRVIPVTLIALGFSAFGPVGLLENANAALLTSGTTVSASPSSSTVGQSVTLTATVGITGLGGLGVTPTGSVTFTTGTTTLGTSPLNTCVLTPCIATLATSALPRGTDTVVATYPGDGVVGGSNGSTSITVKQVATPTAPYQQTCPAHQPCDTGVVYADDGSSSIDVAATASNSSDTINTYLGGSSLPCTTAGTGEPGNYTVSSTDVSKTITYKLYGTPADTFNTAHPSSNPPHVCYLSSLQFSGYYPSGGHWTGTSSDYAGGVHPVPYNSSLQGYLGLLPACNAQKSNSPCVVSQTFALGTGGSQDTVTFVLYEAFKQKCDPHISS